METVREVLERFNLNIDLSEELLNLEVRGGYKTYEIEYFDDAVSDDDVKYIFTSDRQFILLVKILLLGIILLQIWICLL